MKAQVNVCDGCCCGRVNKSNMAVPIDSLKSAWEEYELSEHVKLNITTCLGPCSQANVMLVKADQKRTWLGGISNEEQYQSLINWAKGTIEHGQQHPLPDSLLALQFTPN